MPVPESQKVFLITGCSSGLGTELALAVLATGHKLIATSRNPSKTPELAEKVTALGGSWIEMDVTSPDLPSQVEEALKVYGRIDVLVNNAGIAIGGAVEDFDSEQTLRLFNTNLFGPLRLTQLLVPHMRKLGGGTILNISSASIWKSQPGIVLYAASKAAFAALSDGLALELSPFNIKVFTLVPGDMRTSFADPKKLSSSGNVLPISAPYKGTMVEYVMNAILSMHGKQTIDAKKAAERMVGIATGDVELGGTKGRIPIGSDSGREMGERGSAWVDEAKILEGVWEGCEFE